MRVRENLHSNNFSDCIMNKFEKSLKDIELLSDEQTLAVRGGFVPLSLEIPKFGINDKDENVNVNVDGDACACACGIGVITLPGKG